METESQSSHTVHQGRNLQRIRQARNIKQTTLAEVADIPQQTLSRYEQMETIPDKAITKLAAALKVPEEFIRNMEDTGEVTINVESNTIDGKDNISNIGTNVMGDISGNTFNPIEKIIQLSDERAALYERLLKSAQEKMDSLEKRMELLEQLVEKKK